MVANNEPSKIAYLVSFAILMNGSDQYSWCQHRYFVMHYYLSDDSVEINNNYMRNSGRWECPVFFTRKKLELQPTMTCTPGMYKPESPLLKASDIEVTRMLRTHNPILVRFLVDFVSVPALDNICLSIDFHIRLLVSFDVFFPSPFFRHVKKLCVATGLPIS